MGPRVSSRAVIGRDAAREVVEGLLELAAEGRARLGLVAGEAGIGKTRLVGDLEVRARERGFVVLHGESVEFGGDELPYAPVVAALRDLPDGWAAADLDALPGEAREQLGALLPRVLPAPSEAPARFSGRFGQGRLYGRLLPQERRRMHRAIAAALAEAPDAPAAQLAHQWHRAGEPADALRASVAAGLEASGLYAFAEARVHLERALDLWDGVSPAADSLPVDRIELLARAAQAARFAGDPQRAITLCEEALDRLDHAQAPVRASLLYERLGEFHFWDDATALGCCTSCCSISSAGWRARWRRCCWCWRTSTGPTAHHATCWPSSPATSVRSGSPSSPPTAPTSSRSSIRCAGWSPSSCAAGRWCGSRSRP